MAEKQSQTENKDMRDALAAAHKVDAKLETVLRERKRVKVQFKEGYARGRQYNRIDPTVVEVYDYAVKAGDVVALPESEVERLSEVEGLIETNSSKFDDVDVYERQWNDKTQKAEMVKVNTIKAKDLIENAPERG